MKQREYYEHVWRQRTQKEVEMLDQRTLERAKLAAELVTLSSGTILDVGCGSGVTASLFKDMGFRVRGIDISSKSLRLASEKGIDVDLVNLEYDEISGQYDVILCLEVLEHLFDPLGALIKMKGCLKLNGQMILSLPNEFHIVRRLQILVGQQDFSRHDWPHLRFFDRRAAFRLADAAGLRIDSMRYVSLFPPRWTGVQSLGKALTLIRPTLFSLAFVFRAQRK